MIGLIWAQAADGVIGADGGIPWHLAEDLAHFAALTRGSTVVMGRRTWESLPERFRPLPDRRNVVVTRQAEWHDDGAEAVTSVDDALVSGDTVWVIGGAQLYAAAIDRADRLEVTELELVTDGDSYAPPIGTDWRAEHIGDWLVSTGGLRYRFRRYTRR